MFVLFIYFSVCYLMIIKAQFKLIVNMSIPIIPLIVLIRIGKLFVIQDSLSLLSLLC